MLGKEALPSSHPPTSFNSREHTDTQTQRHTDRQTHTHTVTTLALVYACGKMLRHLGMILIGYDSYDQFCMTAHNLLLYHSYKPW